MSPHVDALRIQLGRGPIQVRQLVENLGLSQPTISRTIVALGDEVVRVGAGRSIQYTLRDTGRGIGEIPIYRVSAEGTIRQLGTLIPVRPDGFVMLQSDGKTLHSDALPWWLYDMRPQGYLGRAYAARHAEALGLPNQLTQWNDSHALRALLAHGHDAIGNLLLGNTARDAFLSSTSSSPIAEAEKPEAYVRFAEESARGEQPGSSAGGEQPKFVTYAETPAGPCHVIVKFTDAEDNSVTERWRDLLLAEHLALCTLNEAGISAVRTRVMDFGTQRFLEVERFDRIRELGRRGLFSLAALDAEFVGAGAGWSRIAHSLARGGYIHQAAAEGASLLQAIGVLIGNTDMHTGNLSFVSEHARPYDLAPAYDMLPMGFAPKSGGGIPSTLLDATIHADISPEVWVEAEPVARRYLNRLRSEQGFSQSFQPCIDALAHHIESAAGKIARLG